MAGSKACLKLLLTFRNVSDVLRLTWTIAHLVDQLSRKGRKNNVVSIPQQQEIFIMEKMTSDATLLTPLTLTPTFMTWCGAGGGGHKSIGVRLKSEESWIILDQAQFVGDLVKFCKQIMSILG